MSPFEMLKLLGMVFSSGESGEIAGFCCSLSASCFGF
jgi:hypothetical protein